MHRHPAEVAAEALLRSALAGAPTAEELNALRQSIRDVDAKAQNVAATGNACGRLYAA